MKETYQRELAEVAKVKRERKKEADLIDEILLEKSRMQVIEKAVPTIGENEPDILQEEILVEKKILHKGGDAEKTESVIAETPAHINTEDSENQPTQSKKQDQPLHNGIKRVNGNSKKYCQQRKRILVLWKLLKNSKVRKYLKYWHCRQ